MRQDTSTCKASRRLAGEAMLRDGELDIVVARKVGVSREAVRLWRNKLGLPSRRLAKITRKQRDQIRKAPRHQTAAEIAKRVGCCVDTVRKWRNKLKRPYVHLVSSKRDQAVALRLTHHVPVREIAKQLKVSPNTIYKWINRAGVRRARRKITPEIADKCLQVLTEVGSPAKAARILGYAPVTVELWAHRARLARDRKDA